ncbi:MAG: M20 family metallopeptidase [Dehalococcoidia bacterium]|nr:MAG: M20 family metallopeptidase [Dehalococcoidia bacterium]
MSRLDDVKKRAIDEIEARRDELIELSLRIHANPEMGFREAKAAGWLTDYLEAEGFAVERGICEIGTAFRASSGSGRPRVAFLAEYDALAGIGHGCGHNIIAMASVGAAIATKAIVPEAEGTALVIGTPAEESAGGKVFMANRGAFDDLDVAMLVHPANRDVAVTYALALLALGVQYFGKAAHAAARPDAGINALDALVIGYSSVNALRQHIRESARIHGIITDGGQAVNVVPEHAAGTFLLRAEDDDYLEELKEKVLACFRAGAEATGARLEYRWGEEARYRAMRSNRTLAEAYRRNMEALGRQVQEEDSQRSMGSTDMGNVSVLVPAIHPTVAIAPPDVPIHTPEFRDIAASEAGHRGLLDSAKAMAMTAADVLLDADLRRGIEEEFRGGE